MSRWVDVPIVGGSYADDTRDWSFQDTVNWLPMRAERPGGRSLAMLRDVPGLRLKSVIGTGPYRGYRDVEGKLFVVSGTKLYQVRTDFTATEIGTIPGVGPVSMTHNQVGLDGGNELVIGTTDSGYVYNTKTGIFSQITDPGFPGLQSADFIGGYIIGIEPQRRYWYHSELADAREYNTTDIYSAESSPDRLSRVIVANGEVAAIGERSTDFFENFVSGNAAFQYKRGCSSDKGTISPDTVRVLDNTLFMLGSDGIVYRLDGYRWARVSHHPLEQAIAECDPERAFAFTYEDRGHAIYNLTFPDGKTWGYDVSQGEWARRQSYGFDRWRVSGLVRWDGAWYAGDFANGKLYQVDWDYPGLEDQDEFVRRRIPGVLHDDGNLMAVNAVRLRVSSGLPKAVAAARSTIPAYPALTISGNLTDVAWQGDSEDYTYTVSGGVAPYTIDVSAGALPGGITQVGTTARISGKRTTTGAFNWTMRVTDADGRTATVADSTTTKSAEIFVWREKTIPSTQVGFSCHASGDVVVVGQDNNVFSYSLDRGVTWTLKSGVFGLSRPVVGTVKYAGDWYFVAAAGGTQMVKSSGDDFTTLTTVSRSFETSATYQQAHVVGDYMYVSEAVSAASSNNFAIHRFDGTTWTAINTGIAGPANAGISSMRQSGSYTLLGTTDGKVLRTADFVTFGVVLTTGVGNAVSVADVAGKLVAANGTLYESTDNGATWTAGYAGPRVVIANGLHFIYNDGAGSVFTSSTGASGSWTQRLSVGTRNVNAGHTYKDLSVYLTATNIAQIGDVA